MKKNIILYVILVFLIIMNGFFVFNYTFNSSNPEPRGPKGNIEFIVKQLKFDKNQLKELRRKSIVHHQSMQEKSFEIRRLKATLFSQLSEEKNTTKQVDSIASLIGFKEKERDLEVFRYFRFIQSLCNDEQKKKFETILEDALERRSMQGRRPPRQNRRIPGM